jgi:hypothetical protein
MLPRPTAEPAAAKININFDDHIPWDDSALLILISVQAASVIIISIPAKTHNPTDKVVQ